MNDIALSVVIACFALAAGLACALTCLCLHWAPRWGWIDQPDGRRKLQTQAVPLMGGAAIYLAMLIVGTVATLAGRWTGLHQVNTTSTMPLIWICGGLICLVGLWDDRRPLRPRHKFLLQVLACLPLALFGRTIVSVHALGNDLQLGWLAVPFTIFWLVACANAVNLVDGMDGLASTIGLVSLVTLAILSGVGGNQVVMLASVIAAGAVCGFLVHNLPPARIYLGDAGSLTLGYFVGALGIECSMKTATGFALVAPLVVLSVPAFDTLMAILRRKLTGKCIGEPDRGHIHHRLQALGLTRAQTLLTIGCVCVAMALVAIMSTIVGSDWIAVACCMLVLCLLIVGRVFGYDETILFFRHLQAVSLAFSDTTKLLRTRVRLIHLHQAAGGESRDLMWSRVCGCAEAAGATRVVMQGMAQNADVLFELQWRSTTRVTSDMQWRMEVAFVRGQQQIVIRVEGAADARAKPLHVEGLYRHMAGICQFWPLSESQEASTAAATLPLLVPDEQRRAA
jgi:UDP-GlcNAc:undecaprenyl-phosphate/decaprenyl-phosphate GlcNAc-1-phosphate transferase